MDYQVEKRYSLFKEVKILDGFYLHFDKLSIGVWFNVKYFHLDITIWNSKENYKKVSDIHLTPYLRVMLQYIRENEMFFLKKDGFKKDILDVENIKNINIRHYQLTQEDIAIISSFPKLLQFSTTSCFFTDNCNFGYFKGIYTYMDSGSTFSSLDIFNGFEGQTLKLGDSKIMNQNKNVLHLNNICTHFDNLQNMDYEHFFLTTDASKMRKLEIYSNPRLKDKDLLFISGFYNLESVSIEGDISSYEQIGKLEKLRVLLYLFCTDEKELERTKEKRKDFATYFGDKSLEIQKNYLMTQRMFIQREYQKFFHKLYVPRLERVRWQDKISSYDLEQIKVELENIAQMSRKERKQLAREPKKEYNLFDSLNELWFDKIPNPNDEDDCYLANSNPNPFDLYDDEGKKKGIDYYVLKRKIYIEE